MTVACDARSVAEESGGYLSEGNLFRLSRHVPNLAEQQCRAGPRPRRRYSGCAGLLALRLAACDDLDAGIANRVVARPVHLFHGGKLVLDVQQRKLGAIDVPQREIVESMFGTRAMLDGEVAHPAGQSQKGVPKEKTAKAARVLKVQTDHKRVQVIPFERTWRLELLAVVQTICIRLVRS